MSYKTTAFYGDAPASPVTGIPGWETPDEEQTLMTYVRRVPGHSGVIVEIGAEYGRSAGAFCAALNGLDVNPLIVSVDLFPGDLLDHHRKNLELARFGGQTAQLKGNSQTVEIPQLVKDGIDLLFIDGDHTFEGALADLDRWTPMVKEGAYLLVHDCACSTNRSPHFLHFEVTRALMVWYTEHQAGQWRMIESVDSMMVFQRTAQERIYRDLVDALKESGKPSKIQFDEETNSAVLTATVTPAMQAEIDSIAEHQKATATQMLHFAERIPEQRTQIKLVTTVNGQQFDYGVVQQVIQKLELQLGRPPTEDEVFNQMVNGFSPATDTPPIPSAAQADKWAMPEAHDNER